MSTWEIRDGNCLELLHAIPSDSVDCCVTSPPYYQQLGYALPDLVFGGFPRHQHEFAPNLPPLSLATGSTDRAGRRTPQFKGDATTGRFCSCGAWLGVLGLEPTPNLYLVHLAEIFIQVARVLKPTGSLWLNLDDTTAKRPFTPWNAQAGSYLGLPWRLALRLMEDVGLSLVEEVIWWKATTPPKPATDRHYNHAHEPVFHFAKGAAYYYDHIATQEPTLAAGRGQVNLDELRGTRTPAWALQHQGRQRMSVQYFGRGVSQGHAATFSTVLPDLAILATTSAGGNCAHCGVPYQRLLKPGATLAAARRAKQDRQRKAGQPVQTNPLSDAEVRAIRAHYPDRDLGFQPQCVCTPAAHVPALVLDPFSGTATTGLAALQNGRRYLGLELNATFAADSRARLGTVLAA